MEWIIGGIVVFVLISIISGSCDGGEKRKFKCDCGANCWNLLNSWHFDNTNGSYNYKEQLECLKCKNIITNERHI